MKNHLNILGLSILLVFSFSCKQEVKNKNLLINYLYSKWFTITIF